MFNCFCCIRGGSSVSPEQVLEQNHWLLNEQDDVKRTQKLEKYLRGFDQPMLEVGQRYQSLYQALVDNNFELANYHWKKTRQTIENGVMKRPARKANAEQYLLDNKWLQIKQDLVSRNSQRAWHGFNKIQVACMSCHVAEGVAFVNNQPIFRLNQPTQ